MKKSLLISIGAIIILLVVGVWAYLLMYGAPENSSEVFARFGIGGEERQPTVLPETTIVDVGNSSTNGTTQRLRQLTTRAVAGAGFTGTGILYAEQGTGHIYHINLSSGGETLISGTTIPQAHEALFSEGGAYVAITSLENGVRRTTVGSITSDGGVGALEGAALPSGSTEFAFGNATGTLRYLLKNTSGSTGHLYNIEKRTSEQIFAIPLRDVRVLWGDPLYVYTIPSGEMLGHLYQIRANALTYVTAAANGMAGIRYGDGVIITESNGQSLASIALDQSGMYAVPFGLLPEKCVPHPERDAVLYCSSQLSSTNAVLPDAWYKGAVSFDDVLWEVEVGKPSARLLTDFLAESGREIDVKKIGTNATGDLIYFINKNDNTLWMFDTTL